MIYLESFHMPSCEEDENFFSAEMGFKGKNSRIGRASQYPFVMFRERGLPEAFEFGDITIFCGNNGSGKSTVLNVIAEKLGLKRNTLYNRSDFFDDYTGLCRCVLNESPSRDSAIITSDDVFDRVLDIRRLNDGIDNKKERLLREWLENNHDGADARLHGIDDYDRWKNIKDARNKNVSQTQYLRSRLVRNIEERSNGESALAFFVDAITDDALFLLDEPENSLSPSNQMELKYFIEDSVRNHACQFIISTHSPFLLSLRHARIYDIDSVPVKKKSWTELDCVKVYHEFFESHADEFTD